jgi:hypothetical protein
VLLPSVIILIIIIIKVEGKQVLAARKTGPEEAMCCREKSGVNDGEVTGCLQEAFLVG